MGDYTLLKKAAIVAMVAAHRTTVTTFSFISMNVKYFHKYWAAAGDDIQWSFWDWKEKIVFLCELLNHEI